MLKEQTNLKIIEERFIVRPPQLSDVEDVLEMLEICDLTMVGEIEVTAEMLRTDWTNPRVSPDRNFRVVTTQSGRVVGYGELWDEHDPLDRAWCWNRVHPEFEGQGIGTYLMDWAEDVAQQSMVKAPPEVRFTMDAGVPSGYQPAINLMLGQNMHLKRSFYTMQIDLEDQPTVPQLPENIAIRTMRGMDELPDIVRAIQESFRDHWGYVEYSLESEIASWEHRLETTPFFDQTLWFLAVEGDQIAGISLCWPKHGPNEQLGWVGTLGVLRPWRRQGLGLALLRHSFAELYRRGKNRVALGVDADSLTGATRLYEKAGMRVVRQFDAYEKELRAGIDMATRTVEE